MNIRRTKSEEEIKLERNIMKSFGVGGRGTPEQREAAEIIAARTEEVLSSGGSKSYGFFKKY